MTGFNDKQLPVGIIKFCNVGGCCYFANFDCLAHFDVFVMLLSLYWLV